MAEGVTHSSQSDLKGKDTPSCLIALAIYPEHMAVINTSQRPILLVGYLNSYLNTLVKFSDTEFVLETARLIQKPPCCVFTDVSIQNNWYTTRLQSSRLLVST